MRSFGSDLTTYLGRIWELRFFLRSLVTMDLRSRYRRSYLGIGWSLVRPLAMTAVFCLVFCNILGVAPAEYAPYVLIGLTVWQFIAEAALTGCTSIVQGGHYIRQQPVPLAVFPLRTVLSAAFHATIALGLAIALAWAFRAPPSFWPTLTLLPSLALLFLLGWFLAILGAVFFAHFHDTQHLLEIFLQIYFYFTPIFYFPKNLHDRVGWLMDWNPFYYVLECIRRPVLEGTLPPLQVYAIFAGFVVFVGCLACAALRKWERSLVYWL